MIKATAVHKTYGKKANPYEALRGIDLSIADGISLAIVGKSGSGKSTLLHVLAALDKPSSGDIRWDNHLLTNLSEDKLADLRNQQVGFIFQQFYLQPTLTVLENVILPLKIIGLPHKERQKRGIKALKDVGLADKANNRATDLSGGQRQRVAIARAIVNRPTVIFADEPTGNLDSETGRQVIDLLFKLQAEQKITLVIVTHDHDLAARCNKLIKIQDGKLVK